MLYNVGGNPYDNYSFSDSSGMTDNIAKPYFAQAEFFVNDVRTERSFGTAVRDARNDARSYYDLKFAGRARDVQPHTQHLLRSAL